MVAVVHHQAAGMSVLLQVANTPVLPGASMAVLRVTDIIVPHQVVAGIVVLHQVVASIVVLHQLVASIIVLQVIGIEAFLQLASAIAHLQLKDVIVHHRIKSLLIHHLHPLNDTRMSKLSKNTLKRSIMM